MRGKLLIDKYDDNPYTKSGIYLDQDPYDYEICISGNLEDDFITLITKEYDFDMQIDAAILFHSDDMYKADFLEIFRKNRIDYIMSVEYVEFNYSLEEISEYIKKNPILKTKKIIINVDFDLDINFLNKFISLFGENNKNIYFNLIGNSSLIGFNEYRDTVCKIDMICKDVERFNFSPLEKIMYLYDVVRDRVYLDVGENEDKRISRDLSSSLLGNRIVCVGYAKIFMTLLNKLGIKCREEIFNSVNNDGGHARCEVYIEDSKYNVDGVYYFDPTWDCKKNEKNNNYLYSYRYFALTKSMMDEMDKGKFFQSKFACFSKNIVSIVKDKVEKDGFENMDRDLVDTINHMAKVINDKHLIDIIGLHPLAPESFKPDKNKVMSELNKLVKYFDKPLSADILLKILYNVRKNQYYMDSEKYFFGLNEFYDIVLNSKWEFKKTEFTLLLELLGVAGKELKKKQMVEYARDTGMFKDIQQVKVAHTLRKVLEKKNN